MPDKGWPEMSLQNAVPPPRRAHHDQVGHRLTQPPRPHPGLPAPPPALRPRARWTVVATPGGQAHLEAHWHLLP